jgi:hypothetical protein
VAGGTTFALLLRDIWAPILLSEIHPIGPLTCAGLVRPGKAFKAWRVAAMYARILAIAAASPSTR